MSIALFLSYGGHAAPPLHVLLPNTFSLATSIAFPCQPRRASYHASGPRRNTAAVRPSMADNNILEELRRQAVENLMASCVKIVEVTQRLRSGLSPKLVL